MPLNKEDVVNAALIILDRYGLADLTMRRLGDTLGVKAGALYWHVPNKQSLLADVVSTILSDLDQPGGPWRQSLTQWSRQLRDLLLSHRDSADLVASMRAIGMAGTDLTDAPAHALTTAGLDDEQAQRAAQTLLYFILGHVNEEQQRNQLAPLTSSSAAAPDLARAGQPSFDAGIQLVIDGISQRVAESSDNQQ